MRFLGSIFLGAAAGYGIRSWRSKNNQIDPLQKLSSLAEETLIRITGMTPWKPETEDDLEMAEQERTVSE